MDNHLPSMGWNYMYLSIPIRQRCNWEWTSTRTIWWKKLLIHAGIKVNLYSIFMHCMSLTDIMNLTDWFVDNFTLHSKIKYMFNSSVTFATLPVLSVNFRLGVSLSRLGQSLPMHSIDVPWAPWLLFSNYRQLALLTLCQMYPLVSGGINAQRTSKMLQGALLLF